jgi:hypothetical protein
MLTLDQLAEETHSLMRELSKLVDQYGEEDANAPRDEKIFYRLTGHGWRHLRGMSHVLLRSKRYEEAAKWVDRYSTYLTNLRECFTYSLNWRKRFVRLPLRVFGQLPAEELIRLLEIQHQMLIKWALPSTTVRPHEDGSYLNQTGKGPGKPKSDTTEWGLTFMNEGRPREEILSKLRPLIPGYNEMTPDQQSKAEDRIWKNILAADRNKRSRPHPVAPTK